MMLRSMRVMTLAAVTLLSLAACASGSTEDVGAASSTSERLEVVDKNASGTRISVLVEPHAVAEVRNTGTLEYDEGTKCWTLIDASPEGKWPVVWLGDAEPQSTDGRAGVESPDGGLVSDGDDVEFGALQLPVGDFVNYPQECIAGAENLLLVGGMSVDDGR